MSNMGSDPDYITRNGINYRKDGYAFCDRCGSGAVVNRLCLKCDVKPTEEDVKVAEKIKYLCYWPRMEPMKGFFDGRPEKFDTERAAQVIAAMREPALHCDGCGKCLDCLRRERGREQDGKRE